jgi:hypothetical protein
MSYGSFPAEFSLEPIEGAADLSAARQLATLATQHVRASSLIYRGDGGNYDLYTAESVSTSEDPDAPETILEVTRPAWDEDLYITLENADTETAATIATDVRTVRLEGGHMSRLRDLKSAVQAGQLAGEGTVQTHRFLEAEIGGSLSSLILQMAVSSGHEKDEPPVHTVDLLLSRGYGPEGDRCFNQQYRVVHDEGTGLYLAGSDAVANNGGDRDIIALVNWGAWLQKCAEPGLPVNRMLTPHEWLDVITQPLHEKNMLHLNSAA